eukprot:6643235-Prymnesium_polylepis.1
MTLYSLYVNSVWPIRPQHRQDSPSGIELPISPENPLWKKGGNETAEHKQCVAELQAITDVDSNTMGWNGIWSEESLAKAMPISDRTYAFEPIANIFTKHWDAIGLNGVISCIMTSTM